MSGLASAATLDEIKKRGYMVVVTENDFRPFEYIEDGKPVGYDNELIEKLLKFVPFKIRVVINTLISLNTIVKAKPDVFAVGEAVAAPAYAAWPV